MNGIKNWSWYTPLNGLNLSRRRRRRSKRRRRRWRNRMEEGEERRGQTTRETYRMKGE